MAEANGLTCQDKFFLDHYNGIRETNGVKAAQSYLACLPVSARQRIQQSIDVIEGAVAAYTSDNRSRTAM